MFQGSHLRVQPIEAGCVELCFDRIGAAVNTLDAVAVAELDAALEAIAAARAVRGLLLCSAKESFILGADITQFAAWFAWPQAQLEQFIGQLSSTFTRLERLPVPSVAAISGYALGGGLETALAADYRVLATGAQVGLPEVRLGLLPGFGGSVRLPRIAGLSQALHWITRGTNASAAQALAAGVADELAAPQELRAQALALLQRAVGGDLDWRARRSAKQGPAVAAEQSGALFAAARAELDERAVKHQPAARSAVDLIQHSAGLRSEAALALEAAAFAEVARTQAAASLVQIFLNEQQLKRQYRALARSAHPVGHVAVLGAGIMGGGIAYASALHGVPVRLKDIAPRQLELGMNEVRELLHKQVRAQRLDAPRAEAVLASISAQLDDTGLEQADVIVEAVVENLEIKHRVLRELEGRVRGDAIIASNTSSLRIDDLAAPLARAENFIGMHFFNPVPVMPLVEVIRGSRTSESAVATIVGYSVALGKTPILVKDGPGFLVNRILTPYMLACSRLIADGADFARIDQVMEAFGWPMGPNQLNDVIGLDTAAQVFRIICAGLAPRLQTDWVDSVGLMVAQQRYGQKNGIGFYRYEAAARGRPQRHADPSSYAVLAAAQPHGTREFAESEIIERMMLPLIIEAAHALEDGVVASAAELDMALVLGLGFPRYLGGALKYADWLGLDRLVQSCERYAALGPLYETTATMRRMASAG